jgi:hypothetical protein
VLKINRTLRNALSHALACDTRRKRANVSCVNHKQPASLNQAIGRVL